MAEINANIVVEPYEITITTTNDEITVTPNVTEMRIFTNDSAPGGFPGDIQYNANGLLGGVPTANYVAGNLRLGNSTNLKITGGSNAYFLQTDGTGNLTWAPGTANVSGNGTAAGANNQIQLSDGSGNFKSAPGFTLDTSSNLLSAPGNIYATGIANITGNVVAPNFVGTSFINGSNSNVKMTTSANNIQFYATDNSLIQNLDINAITAYKSTQLTLDNNTTQAILQRTYNNSNLQTAAYTTWRSRGNVSNVQPIANGDYVGSQSYVVYADSGNTFKQIGETTALVLSNDLAGNVQSELRLRMYGNTDSIALSADAVKVGPNPFSTNTYLYSNGHIAALSISAQSNITANNFIGTLANGNSNIKILANSDILITSNGNSNTMTINDSIINIEPEVVINQALTLKKDNVGSDLLFIESYNNSNAAVNGIETRRYRGNTGNPLTVQVGDEIYAIDHRAQYTNGSFNQSTLAGSNTVVTAVNANGNMTVNTVMYASYTNSNLILQYSNVQSNGNIAGLQLLSNIATGTSPIVVQSTTKVANLNADLLDGYDTAVNATSNTIAVRDNNGNISANYFIGNGSQLTGIDTSLISNGSANVRTFANANVSISANGVANVVVVTASNVDVNGNVLSNIVFANTVNSSSFVYGTDSITIFNSTVKMNTTGVDRLIISNTLANFTLPVTTNSNISANNANFTEFANANNIVATSNITANNANLGNLAIANYIQGTLTTNIQPNLSNIGNGQVNINGNLISGNADLGNLAIANYIQGTLTTAAQPNITSVGNLTSLNVTNNITAGNVYANAGTIGASLLTGTLTTSAQPNITSLGNLSGLTIVPNGDIDMSGSGSQLTGANLVSAFYVSGTLTTNAQPNITSVGTLSSLAVTGNISAANVIGNHYGNGFNLTNVRAVTSNGITLTAGASGNYNITMANSTVGNTAISANANLIYNWTARQLYSDFFTGTLTTNAQPNITSVGNLTGLTLAANADITLSGLGSNIQGANIVSANFFSGDGGLLSNIYATGIANGNSNVSIISNGNVYTSVAGNSNIFVITGTGVNVAGTLNATGNATVQNFVSLGNANASTFNGAFVGSLNGQILQASQTNITSVGTLTDLRVSNPNIHIGTNSGGATQGSRAIAIGEDAGNTNQGASAVAIGNDAGQTTQGNAAIALGEQAGANTQSANAIAIGKSAGQLTQGVSAIALGVNAGYQNQGANSIAIGSGAGNVNQHTNTIVINASGANLTTAQANASYMKPIRRVTGTSGLYPLYYDPTSGEIVYYQP